jgi:hypothetical protein
MSKDPFMSYSCWEFFEGIRDIFEYHRRAAAGMALYTNPWHKGDFIV